MNIIQKIMAGIKIIGEVNKMKSGFMTTEFWLSAVTVLGLLLGALLDKIPMATITLIVPVVTGLYIIARTIVKATASVSDDELLEKIEKDILAKLPGYVPPTHD